MKSLFLFITGLLLSINLFSQQQIPNGNFENWTNNEADNWNSSFNLGVTIYTASKTNEAFQGDSAAELTSQSVISQFIPGLITLGVVDLFNMTLTGGIPYTDRPDGIRFFFKYLPSNIDTMFFGAYLTKWNELSLTADTIGSAGYFNSDTYDAYTKIELPFIWHSGENPDTLNIFYASSGFNGNAGSTLLIDSLAMFNGIAVSPTYCFPAKDITTSSFTANWLTIPNATSYSLDVSDNSDFSSFLTGYENLTVGLDTFHVINVSPGSYYYRVRVNYNTESSINSNTIEVILGNSDIKHITIDKIKIFTIQNSVSLTTDDLSFVIAKVYNTDGKLIKAISPKGKKITFRLNSPGIYILEVKTGNQIIRKKFALAY